MKKDRCETCFYKINGAKDLKESDIGLSAGSCVIAVFKKGEVIFKENAMSSNIIFMQKGLVKLTKEGPQRTQILSIRKAPCFLGLPTTMGDKVNNYSAVAIEESTACFIDIDIFKKLLHIRPEFSYQLIVDLCKNELMQFKRCVKLVQNQVFGRLAGVLLQFAGEIYESDEYELPFNRNELADIVCSSRETVSRMMNDLAADGIIKVSGKHITITDKPRLEKISESG